MSMERPDWIAHIRVIGFDLDQTLYPKSPEIDEKIQKYLYEKISEQRDVPLAEAKRLFEERYRGGSGMTGSETLRDLGLANASELVQEALERADIAGSLHPDPDTNRLLADIRAAYDGLDLITGSNRVQTKKKLDALGLSLASFTHVLTADDATKSTGDSYRLWRAAYPHLTADRFLYIGDRVRSDHEIPSALGIRTALVYIREADPALRTLQVKDISSLRSLLLL